MGLPPYGGCNVGGGVTGGGDLRLSPSEHRGAIYCDYVHYGPVSGGKTEARAKSGNEVVGKGGAGFGGDTDSGPGGGADGGGGGDGRDGTCNGRLLK